jgi:hypothetical protein
MNDRRGETARLCEPESVIASDWSRAAVIESLVASWVAGTCSPDLANKAMPRFIANLGSLLRNRRSWSFCWMEWVLKAWKRPVASIRPLGNATT